MAVSMVKNYTRHAACRHDDRMQCVDCIDQTTMFWVGPARYPTVIHVDTPGRGAHRAPRRELLSVIW